MSEHPTPAGSTVSPGAAAPASGIDGPPDQRAQADQGSSLVQLAVEPRSVLAELRTWQPRRWIAATLTAAVTIVFVGVITVLIPNPWFGREVPPTRWAWPVLVVSSVLAGLVAATYVAPKDNGAARGGRLGTAGAFATLFAVGCPVCNKLVLLALGYAGALQFFEPVQPYLAGGAIALLIWALVMRVRRERSCPLPT